MLAERFVIMYRSAGLDRPAVAKLLHVSERTLHNWETGIHDIPYAAYKLVRILTRFELPDPAWRGWHMHSGKLWSPEGHGFSPSDSSWWSLLCRRAQSFSSAYDQLRRLRQQLANLRADACAHGPGVRPAEGISGDVLVTRHKRLTDDPSLENIQSRQQLSDSCSNDKFVLLKVKSTKHAHEGV